MLKGTGPCKYARYRARGAIFGTDVRNTHCQSDRAKSPLFAVIKIIYGCTTLFGSNSKFRLPGFGFK
jgi:hypothetical protein